MKKVVIILFIVIFVSCKDSTEQKNIETKKEIDVPKELVVKVGIKTSKEDVFKISLNNIVIDEFQKKNIQIIETISATNDFESIVAKFGPNNISNNLIFNLGNKEVKEIELNGIEISYGINNILITKNDFNKYFRLNKYVTMDTLSQTLKTSKIDGKHKPSFFARKKLLDLLKTDNQ